MKNLITIFLLSFSLFAHAQSERAQKEAVRTQNSAPRQQIQSSPSREYYQKQDVRSNQRINESISRNPIRRNLGWNDPYYRRWNQWGAPVFGFDYWMPGFYYDRWGYRNPARIYHYQGGRADTIKGKPTRISFGIQGSRNMAGAWLTIGNNGYFIADYSQFVQRDESTFYPDLTMDRVIPWRDERLEDLNSGNVFYLGLGKKFGRTGIHTMAGFGRERKKYQFFDELYVLSNNGKYSIPVSDQNYIGVKFGILHDFKRVTLKLDYEATRKVVFAGVGINL
jgi:hypothetical protein